ncbi:Uridylate kinase [Spatholobus suberectus]|nr:Uridylate kinase [Spatholobus suberectus]
MKPTSHPTNGEGFCSKSAEKRLQETTLRILTQRYNSDNHGIAREVAAVTRLGIEVALVVGGGNIFRGSSWAGSGGLDRSSADYIG